MGKLEEFQNIIGHRFDRQELLINALTHSSFVNESKNSDCKDNERLEFFGDAIIEFFVSAFLFSKFRDYPEGDLTKLRASMVCESSLAICAREIRLGQYLFMGKGEEASGGRERDSITSDAFEALVAAIYLDAGREATEEFINRFLLNTLDHEQLFFDAKTKLQEIVQQMDNASLKYELVSESGPAHAKVFEAAVFLNNREIGRGTGHSKKNAQQQAAECAIKKLNGQGL